MEYLPGGELFDLWKLLLRVSQPLLRFLIAQVALAIDYLHSKSVIHRDLKMENMMFTEMGYIKLIDFGASKQMEQRESITWTICGTLAYAAPEMLNGVGYNYLVDWWALGILCHALSCGEYPIQPVHDHKLMRRSLNALVYLPPESVEPSIGKLITQLLKKNPDERLHGCDALQRAELFQGYVDFTALEKQQYDPGIFFTEEDVRKLPEGSLKLKIQTLKNNSFATVNGRKPRPAPRHKRPGSWKSSIISSSYADEVLSEKITKPVRSRPPLSGLSFMPPSQPRIVVARSDSAKTSAVEFASTGSGTSPNKNSSVRLKMPPPRIVVLKPEGGFTMTRVHRSTPEDDPRMVRILSTPKLRQSYSEWVSEAEPSGFLIKSRSRTDLRFSSDRGSRKSISESSPLRVIHVPTHDQLRSSQTHLSLASPLSRESRRSRQHIVRELPRGGSPNRLMNTRSVFGGFRRSNRHDRLVILRPV